MCEGRKVAKIYSFGFTRLQDAIPASRIGSAPHEIRLACRGNSITNLTKCDFDARNPAFATEKRLFCDFEDQYVTALIYRPGNFLPPSLS